MLICETEQGIYTSMKQLSKEAILSNIQLEHNLLLETLHELSQAQLVEPGVISTPAPGQSCKDLLAHLTAWEQRMLHSIRATINGDALPQYPSTRKFNEQVYQDNKDISLEEVWTNFARSYDESLALVSQLSDEELILGDIWKLVGYNTYNHYKWARTTIRQWQSTHSH